MFVLYAQVPYCKAGQLYSVVFSYDNGFIADTAVGNVVFFQYVKKAEKFLEQPSGFFKGIWFAAFYQILAQCIAFDMFQHNIHCTICRKDAVNRLYKFIVY